MFIRTGVATLVFLSAVDMGTSDIDIMIKIFAALVSAVLIILDCFESSDLSQISKTPNRLKAIAYKVWAWVLFAAFLFLCLYITVAVCVLIGFTA